MTEKKTSRLPIHAVYTADIGRSSCLSFPPSFSSSTAFLHVFTSALFLNLYRSVLYWVFTIVHMSSCVVLCVLSPLRWFHKCALVRCMYHIQIIVCTIFKIIIFKITTCAIFMKDILLGICIICTIFKITMCMSCVHMHSTFDGYSIGRGTATPPPTK